MRPGEDYEIRPCKKCGTELHFIRDKGGQMVPAQKLDVLYVRDKRALYEKGSDTYILRHLPGSGTFWVSHFETCPGQDKEQDDKLGFKEPDGTHPSDKDGLMGKIEPIL